MDINTKNRTELKNYFLAGKIPTQQQFADLIDACFNQAEDGMAKAQGNPIALQAEGDKAGMQDALYFFSSFEDETPNWAINLNPWVDAEVPGSNKPGLNVKDGSGQSQFFIQSGQGHIGIGTIEPSARLSIKGKNNVPLIAAISASSDKSVFTVAQQEGAGVLTVQNADGNAVIRLTGNTAQPSFFLSKVGIGTAVPAAPLSIYGAGKEDTPDSAMHFTSNSILFGGNNAGKYTDSAKITAGIPANDSLNIMGMGTTDQNRKVAIWAEGGMTVKGGVSVSGLLKTTEVVAFSAYVTVDLGGNQKVMKFEALYNTGNHFNNNQFTAPVYGLYLFTMTMTKAPDNENDLNWYLHLNADGYVNGAGTPVPMDLARLTGKYRWNTYSRTVITTLNEGDVLYIEQQGGGKGQPYRSSWEGVLLHALV